VLRRHVVLPGERGQGRAVQALGGGPAVQAPGSTAPIASDGSPLDVKVALDVFYKEAEAAGLGPGVPQGGWGMSLWTCRPAARRTACFGSG